jgi:hypothetical protein
MAAEAATRSITLVTMTVTETATATAVTVFPSAENPFCKREIEHNWRWLFIFLNIIIFLLLVALLYVTAPLRLPRGVCNYVLANPLALHSKIRDLYLERDMFTNPAPRRVPAGTSNVFDHDIEMAAVPASEEEPSVESARPSDESTRPSIESAWASAGSRASAESSHSETSGIPLGSRGQ